MGKSILFLKVIILSYCVYHYFYNPQNAFASFLIIMLTVLSFAVLIPIFNSIKLKVILIISSMIIATVSYFIHSLMLLLIPILILELFFEINLSPKTGIPLILIFMFLTVSFSYDYYLRGIYFVLNGFCIILYLLFKKDILLNSLQKHNDDLRRAIDMLNRRLTIDREFKNQLAYTAQLEERNKIAQEIHDNVGHAISGSLMQLEAAKLLVKQDADKSLLILATAIASLRKGLENIRMTLKNIKPPSEQMGINRLRLFLDDFNSKHTIRTLLNYEGDISKISPTAWKIFLENVSEGITNVIRHSNADCININIYVMNKMIRLQMTDNGFVSSTSIKKGLGISGMEERLLTIGGTLLIDSSKGFSLTMLVPLKGVKNGY